MHDFVNNTSNMDNTVVFGFFMCTCIYVYIVSFTFTEFWDKHF